MPIGKEDILEVLRDPSLHRIRFSVGMINVNSDEYDRIADYIEAGGIKIVPGEGKVAHYYPQINTLKTRGGDPPMDLNVRTNALHECTHIISDINEYNITRLRDEAAAYLAQITYLMLLAPDTEEPPRGLPMNNMMILGMHLVDKYKLNKPDGYNQSISSADIHSMEMAVHSIPEYSYDPDERTDADGVQLDDQQSAVLLSRLLARLGDQLITDDVTQMLSTRGSYSAHENWVTDDNELITLLDSYRRGADPQKRTVRQKLIHIFLTVTQASATQLFRRLSAPRMGDLVSNRFNTVFTPAVRIDMLSALQIPR